MKNRFENLDYVLCDKLLSFIYPDESNMSDQEVEAELQRLGINIRPAWEKIQMALEHSKETECARKDLEYAKKKRLSTLAKLKNIQIPTIQSIREQVIKLIQERLKEPQKSVYCRKLESAASDDDLKALFEDILRLEKFSKGSDDAEA